MSEKVSLTFCVGPACPECGELEQAVDVIVRSRGFRLGPWEFQLWTWGKDIVCVGCSDQRNGFDIAVDAAYDAGARDAYDEAQRETVHE